MYKSSLPTFTDTAQTVPHTFWTHSVHTALAREGLGPWDWLSLKVGLSKHSPPHSAPHRHTHIHTQRPCVDVSPHPLALQGISCGYSCVPTGVGSERHNREYRDDMETDRLQWKASQHERKHKNTGKNLHSVFHECDFFFFLFLFPFLPSTASSAVKM